MTLYRISGGALLKTSGGGLIKAADASDSPLSRNEHPRLGMTSDDLATIGARLSTGGDWFTEYQAWITWLTHTDQWNTTSTALNRKPYYAAAAGFVYQLWPYVTGISYTVNGTHADTQAEWGAKGVTWLQAAMALTGFTSAGKIFDFDYKPIFFAVDWLYDVLTAQQRSDIVDNWMTEWALNDTLSENEAGYPDYAAANFNPFDSNTPECYGAWILAGLALKGFGGSSPQETWLQDGIDRYAWAFRNDDAGTRAITTQETARSGTDSGFAQNESYGFSYLLSRIGFPEFAWRTANGITRSAHYSAVMLRGYPKLLASYVTPLARPGGDAKRYYMQSPGQTLSTTTGGSNVMLTSMGFLRGELAGVDDDAADLAAWIIENLTPESSIGNQYYWLTRFLHAKNTAKSPATISLDGNRYFSAGRMHFRSGWTANDAVVHAYFDRFFAGSHDVGMGALMVQYNGPALPYGHVYNHESDCNHGWGQNVLGVVPISNSTNGTFETGSSTNEDYGFRRMSSSGLATLTADSGADFMDLSTVRVRIPADDSEGIGYLWIDLSRAYEGDEYWSAGSSTKKIVSYARKVIVFPPATPGTDSLRLFVFDSAVAQSTSYEKRQCWLFANDPTIDGSSASGPSRNGSTARKTTYTGATTISYAQTTMGSNKTWITPCAPAVDVIKVQYRYDSGGGAWKAEDPYGVSHDVNELSAGEWSADRGRYRVELIPTTLQTTDHFCTAIEVAPSSSGSQSTTAAIVATSFVGGRIGDVVGLHRTSDGASGTFVLPATGTFTVYLAGLTAGSRSFAFGANITSINGDSSSPASATASADGTVKLTVVVGSAGTGAANTVTVS